MIASNSAIQTFKQCRRKWWLQYELGWQPREREVVGPLPLGSRVHKALERMYAHGEDPVDAYAVLVDADRDRIMEYGGDESALADEAELGRIMIEGYQEWVESEGLDEGLSVIGVEQELRVPLLDGRVELIGKMDLRVRQDDSRSVLDFKHQPLDEPVLTPNGWVRMGDLVPGDYVIGSGWTPVRVTDVYEAGMRDVWEIEFTDHTTVRCSDEHTWPIMVGSPRSTPVNMETSDIIARLATRKSGRAQNLYVQPVTPTAAQDVELPVHPYVLGAWVSNGCRNSRSVHDGTTDHELSILRHVADIEGTGDVAFPDKRTDGRAVAAISLKSVTALQEMGLYDTRSTARYLPDAYVYEASIAQRRQLMAGLMDGDGTVTGSSTTQYQTSSPVLAEHVAMLARSLGWHASIWTQEAPWYTYRGERRTGQPNYRVMLRTTENPFLLHTKNAQKWDEIESRRKVSKQHIPKKIKSVTHIGMEECRCIRVDAEDHLYVTTGGVLTHNTCQSFSDYDLAHMYEQGPTYWLLDRISGGSEEDRINSFTLRLLRKVKRTARATPPFYEQIHIRFNPFAMRSFWTRIHGSIIDMLRVHDALGRGADPLAVAYPSPSRDCRWKCPFVSICPMFDDGSAVDEALRAEYVQGDPYAYYKSEVAE